MSPDTDAGRLRWWILRAHWLLGIPLLYLYTETAPALLLAAAAAWAAGARMDRAGTPRETLSRFAAPLGVAFLAAATADLFLVRRDLLAAASLFVLGIQSIKLLLPKRTRDGWQLCAIALLEFLVAAAVADDLRFALFAFLFLAASAGAMWALHGMEAEEQGTPAGGYVPSRKAAAWALLLVAAAGFLATAVLFLVVPRLEFRRGLQRFARGNAVSGFSDEMTLREVTGIKSDRRVVARVEFPSLERAPDPGGLYLRGAVYSRYARDGWRLSKTPVSTLPRAGFRHLFPDAPPGPASVADITLDPADHPRLFTYGEPVLIEGNFGFLRIDAEGNLSLPQPGHPTMRYRLWFRDAPARRGRAIPPPGAQYLEFPDGYEDVRALGIRVAADAGTDAERASRALGFFGRDFRYTVLDPAPTLRRFLFDEKAGYCEHYAAGLALLLRAAGVPSRVAVGYLGGEWNALGRYLIVRQSDAHAWVEAWVDGRWITLDATPPQGEGSPFFRATGPIGLYIDWLGQRWDKYVMNYSLRMQADAVSLGWSGFRRTRNALGSGRVPGVAAHARQAVAALLLAAATCLWLWKRRRGTRGEKGPRGSRLPAPYARLLRRLDRAGLRPGPGTPMEEMVAAAVRRHPELSGDARRFLSLYHRDRFGPGPIPPELRVEAFRKADRLGKRLAS